MKVPISADMEGTRGVVSWGQVMPLEVVGWCEPPSQDRCFRTRQRFIHTFRVVMMRAGIRMSP